METSKLEVLEKEQVARASKSRSAMDSKRTKPKAPKATKERAFVVRYKRPRGSKACTVCRARKVRCDAEIRMPCSNCATFECECVMPSPRKRAPNSAPNNRNDVEGNGNQDDPPVKLKQQSHHSKTVNGPSLQYLTGLPASDPYQQSTPHFPIKNPDKTMDTLLRNISEINLEPADPYARPNPSQHAKLDHTTQARNFGKSSVASVMQKFSANHARLEPGIWGFPESTLSPGELEVLRLRGAYLFPGSDLCRSIVEDYFEHAHPITPIINRTDFMARFNDPDDNPLLMLLQAVLLCGCRVSQNPLIIDGLGSTHNACVVFLRRAQALYEARIEKDPVAVLQTLLLLSTFWNGRDDVSNNTFYWTRVAIALAQGYGFQRDISSSQDLTSSEKKTWRRVWWCLFEKDRNVAIAFGRPTMIDLNDCDVPMLTIDDFEENDPENGISALHPLDEVKALYYIHLVKLAEITGIILKHQYSVKLEFLGSDNKISIIRHCDMLMGVWFTNLPHQLAFNVHDPNTQTLYSCLLNAQYYNRLYLIHRANLLRVAKSDPGNMNNYRYPSWGISFTAARMIAIVSKILLARGQIRYCPGIYSYVLFSALLMLVYHVDSTDQHVAETAIESLDITRKALSEFARNWPIAGTLLILFDDFADNTTKRAAMIEKGNESPVRIVEPESGDIPSECFPTSPGGSASYESRTRSLRNSCSRSVSESGEVSFNKAFSPPVASFSSIPSPQTPPLLVPRAGPLQLPLSQSQGPPQHAQYANESSARIYAKSQPENLPPINYYERHPAPREAASAHSHLVDHNLANSTSSSNRSSSMVPQKNSMDIFNLFPEVFLVTENMPTSKTFYQNFEPTQLFPDTNPVVNTGAVQPQYIQPSSIAPSSMDNSQQDSGFQSYPPQSQSLAGPGSGNMDGVGNPIAQEINYEQPVMDNSFINMTLAPGMDLSYLNDGFENFGSSAPAHNYPGR